MRRARGATLTAVGGDGYFLLAHAMHAARRFVVRGAVQGVGFRWFVLKAARLHGVAGWVRNRADGSVEALAQGSGASLEAFGEALARGPGRARVDSVETEDRPADAALTGFDIR